MSEVIFRIFFFLLDMKSKSDNQTGPCYIDWHRVVDDAAVIIEYSRQYRDNAALSCRWVSSHISRGNRPGIKNIYWYASGRISQFVSAFPGLCSISSWSLQITFSCHLSKLNNTFSCSLFHLKPRARLTSTVDVLLVDVQNVTESVLLIFVSGWIVVLSDANVDTSADCLSNAIRWQIAEASSESILSQQNARELLLRRLPALNLELPGVWQWDAQIFSANDHMLLT